MTPSEAVEAVRKYGSIGAAARGLGISRSTLRDRYHAGKHRTAHAAHAAPEFGGDKLAVDERSEGMTLDSLSVTVRTVDDAIDKAKVDTALWEVDRYTVNSWEVAMKQDDGSARVVPLWQVKVWLRRKVTRIVEDMLGGLMSRMTQHAPKYPKLAARKIRDPHLLEVSIFDAHFGKLAWAAETGQNYDLRIAERIYRNAVEEIVARTAAFPVERIVLPVGNDFFNIDNLRGETTAGTRQDNDGRYAKIFETGQAAVVHAVDYLQRLAPVEVKWVPGNHDETTSWHLVHTLKAWYRNCPNVTIDDSPNPRKRIRYGESLIGYTHGNEEKHVSLPTIMANEWPQDWAATTCHEWHLGHFHKEKETSFVGTDTVDGVVVRVVPSISGRDYWHHRKGYVGRRAAQAFLYNKLRGFAGFFSANVNEKLVA